MDNININTLMDMISKMDKKELENGMNKLSQMMSKKDKEEILRKLNDEKKKF